MHEHAPHPTSSFPAAPTRQELLLEALVSGLQELSYRAAANRAEQPPYLQPLARPRGDLRGLLIQAGQTLANQHAA